MNTIKNFLILSVIFIGVTFMTLFFPDPAEARVKTIWPDEFILRHSCEYRQRPNFFKSADTRSCKAWAPLNIKIGKRITKIVYKHMGNDSTTSTSVMLVRLKYGDDEEVMATASSTDGSGININVETADIDYPVVKRGYRYYLLINSNNKYSEIKGIKVFYQ